MATTYITPTGSGDKSGSSWANAAAITNLDAMVSKAGVGGTVLLAANKGDYVVKAPISVNGSGVTIKGINTDGTAGEAHFTGTRAAEWTKGAADGNELFRINKGADNLVFQNMQIDNTGTAFKVGGDVKNLTVQHIDANNVQRFFENYATGTNKTATISGLKISDVDVKGFSENAIRLQYDTHDVVIENVRGDSERQDDDGFAMGVHLEDTVHNVVFRKVTMENATGDRGSGTYWNGDGFAAERGTYNLTFEDTVSRGNTDAGYDIKASHVTFIRALAEDNARNFRIWGDDVKIVDSTALNPNLRGGSGSQVQIWVDARATVSVVNSDLSDSGSKTRVIEGKGSVTLIGTTIEQADTATTVLGTKPVGLAAATIQKIVATGTSSQGATYSDGSVVTGFTKAVAPEEVLVTAPTPTAPSASAPAAGGPSNTGAWTKVAGTAANETFKATSLAEMFLFDQSKANGVDVIKGFAGNDLVVFTQKLGDANGDGITTFGKDGVLNISTGNSLKIEGLTKGLRLIGQTADGYVYGDASVWKAGSTLPTAVAQAYHASTAANETYVATNARDTFYFDVQAGKTGADTIKGFGKTDAIVTKVALVDGNGDGYIVPGKLGLDLGGGTGNLVKGLDLGKSGLRVMGSTDEGFVYADAAVRPKGAIEGKLTVSDTLSGGKTDSATDTFFFDTALHRALGADKVVNFGDKDVIVTTSQIGSGAVGSHIDATGGSFTLYDEGVAMGSVAVSGIGGAAVNSLEFDGVKHVDGVSYYVYSHVGSAIGLDALG
ncbi:hypothetical protein [Sphingomonas gellani]|nr:hypothetical protein [Sphingomonas gellani]